MNTPRIPLTIAIVVIVAFVLSGPARATPITDTGLFDIFIDITDPITESTVGMFSADEGIVTSFMATIGDCLVPEDCLFDSVIDMIWDGEFLTGEVGTVTGRKLFVGGLSWQTDEGTEGQVYSGTYSVALKVSEPSALLLTLIGIAAIAGLSLRSRSPLYQRC